MIYTLCAVVSVAELPKAKESIDYAMPFILAGLAAVHFMIIRLSKRTRKLVSDFRYYAAFLVHNKSISALCRSAKESQKDVEKKLIQMCKRGYFKGQPDFENDCMKMDTVSCAARCPGCGAVTKIHRNGDKCRYCGNPLEVGSSDPV